MALEDTLTGSVFEQFRELVHAKAGIALSSSKQSLVISRLAKRAQALGCRTFQEYYDVVVREPEGGEFLQMVDCITTNKTDFFREPLHFDFLRDTVLPLSLPNHSLRIWSAACSSGEEPYSIAMTILDRLGSGACDWRILASDISTRMLLSAQEGLYDEERVRMMDERILHRHFLRGKGLRQGTVRVKPHLGERIVFRRINLMDEQYPIKTPLDVIFCRNVMIYFDRATQEQVLRKLCRYLRVGGYLFVGHSESLQSLRHSFTYVAPTIYRKG